MTKSEYKNKTSSLVTKSKSIYKKLQECLKTSTELAAAVDRLDQRRNKKGLTIDEIQEIQSEVIPLIEKLETQEKIVDSLDESHKRIQIQISQLRKLKPAK